jgi:putative ABC transport system ATP-binding protein
VVLFLGDGRIVDEMERPTAEAVLERMRHFSGGRPAAGGASDDVDVDVVLAADSDGVPLDASLDTLDTFDKD